MQYSVLLFFTPYHAWQPQGLYKFQNYIYLWASVQDLLKIEVSAHYLEYFINFNWKTCKMLNLKGYWVSATLNSFIC